MTTKQDSTDDTRHRLAILYADVSGSTRLYEKFGDKVARSDIAICLKLLSEVAEHLQGSIVKTIGDEIMCQFANPVKAALAACEMQESLRNAGEAGRFESGPLRIKIGWHYGEVAWRGHELIGEAPVMAQQIIRGARAGEILTSGATVNVLPAELSRKAYPMGTITSEITGDQVPIFGIRWEETDEATEISGTGEKSEAHTALVLEFGDKKVRVDEKHPWCHIGRAHENELCVNGQFASRLHAAIEYRHSNFHIKDQSVNGTVIHFNDGRVLRLHREEGMLTGGGRIGIGSSPDDDPASAVTFYCK
jgi:class 3 adenylate cyclase